MAVFCVWKIEAIEMDAREVGEAMPEILYGLVEAPTLARASERGSRIWNELLDEIYVTKWKGTKEQAFDFARRYRKSFHEERKENPNGTKQTQSRLA